MTDKNKLKEYLRGQIVQTAFRARAYVFDTKNNELLTRNIFTRLQSHLEKFLEGNRAFRLVVLTGLRGAGKTTLMYQLYFAKKNIDAYFLSLHVNEVVGTLGSSISDIMYAFEEVIGKSLADLDKPLLLFLDEVQYDEKWSIALKTLYDKSDKIFVFATGSAAVLVNSNNDIARRAIFEKVFPLSFTEFMKVKHQKKEVFGLADKMRESILSATSAKEVFEKWTALKKSINKYYFDISRLEFEKYLNYGSLPFMVALDNEALVYDQINKSLERVINKDIPQMKTMSRDVASKIPAILYAVADMDALNFSTLAEKFGISRPKISEIFGVLEQAEVLHRIYPIGSHFKQVTQRPSKYLFSSPAFRTMYYKTIGNTISEQNARGKLLEDLIGMYLYTFFDKKVNVSLNYDAEKGGADFIIGVGNKKIVIEVGVNKNKYRQVIQTMKKVKATYGIIISEKAEDLEYNETENIIKIPLKHFLLAIG